MKADSPVVTYVYESDSYGGSHNPNIGVLHDVECPLEDGYAESLIGSAWFGGPAPTSTHYLVGPDAVCQGVPEGRIAWHCGTGNPRTIAVEQCGYARYNREQWNSPKGRVQRTNIAKLMADINRRRPVIRLKWLTDDELRYAFNNPGSPGGWATHDQMRRVIGGTTHYDPMNAPNADSAYPLSELMAEANGNTPEQDWFDMATEEQLRAIVREEVGNRLKDLDPILRGTFNLANWTNTHMDELVNPETGIPFKVWSQLIKEYENLPAWALLGRASVKDEAPKD